MKIKYNYVVIEGNIGAGKTTLAGRIADQFNAHLILEHFADNSEETVLANTGMLLWSGMHDNYKQVGMGWQDNSNISL